jgi:hypothetical protein
MTDSTTTCDLPTGQPIGSIHRSGSDATWLSLARIDRSGGPLVRITMGRGDDTGDLVSLVVDASEVRYLIRQMRGVTGPRDPDLQPRTQW